MQQGCALNERTGEIAKSGIMADHEQSFHRLSRAGDKASQCTSVGIVEGLFGLAGNLLRQLPHDRIERLARPPGGRDQGEIGMEVLVAEMRSHAHGIRAALRRQRPFAIALGGVPDGFGMANKEEPRH